MNAYRQNQSMYDTIAPATIVPTVLFFFERYEYIQTIRACETLATTVPKVKFFFGTI